MSPRPTTPPQHGERRCYLRGCRRPECLDAHYRYMSRYRLDREHGQRRRVPADTARERVRALLDAGWLQSQIADTAGCSRRSISDLASGRSTSVNRDSEQRILAVQPGPPPPLRDVDATGTIRRVQALAVIGWPIAHTARRIGIHPDALACITRGERPTVRAATATATARAYRELSRTPGPSTRTRTLAAHNGWHGPMAWDETTIDDPAAQPETCPAGDDTDLTPEERAAEILHLAAFGTAPGEIAARVDRSESYVRQILTGGRGPGWRQQLRKAA